MTKKEALIAVLQVSIPDSSIEKALIDAGITGGDTYTGGDAATVDVLCIDLLAGLLTSPNISEGGFSISYDRKSVLDRVLFLARKYGKTDIITQLTAKPTVTSVSRW